jgi:ubiquinone/menaquinone biosynthesis C-methylase UbiE
VTEPSAVCVHRAEPRIADSSISVELADLIGEHLDLSSEQFDAVLSTWTLCTIPVLSAVLAQIRHVLKPGGAVRFVEHGHAPDAKVTR